jgi:triacylglycerol esterase/lipase EstA (alpha/beta hydrolase family)
MSKRNIKLVSLVFLLLMAFMLLPRPAFAVCELTQGLSQVPVLLVHGFGGSPKETWGDMKELLENEGFEVCYMDYEGSKDESIEDLAAGLSFLIDNILSETGSSEIDIVAHSMGGLIVRAYMTGLIAPWGKPYKGKIRRFIMAGTLNHGSAWAALKPCLLIN